MDLINFIIGLLSLIVGVVSCLLSKKGLDEAKGAREKASEAVEESSKISENMLSFIEKCKDSIRSDLGRAILAYDTERKAKDLLTILVRIKDDCTDIDEYEDIKKGLEKVAGGKDMGGEEKYIAMAEGLIRRVCDNLGKKSVGDIK